MALPAGSSPYRRLLTHVLFEVKAQMDNERQFVANGKNSSRGPVAAPWRPLSRLGSVSCRMGPSPSFPSSLPFLARLQITGRSMCFQSGCNAHFYQLGSGTWGMATMMEDELHTQGGVGVWTWMSTCTCVCQVIFLFGNFLFFVSVSVSNGPEHEFLVRFGFSPGNPVSFQGHYLD